MRLASGTDALLEIADAMTNSEPSLSYPDRVLAYRAIIPAFINLGCDREDLENCADSEDNALWDAIQDHLSSARAPT